MHFQPFSVQQPAAALCPAGPAFPPLLAVGQLQLGSETARIRTAAVQHSTAHLVRGRNPKTGGGSTGATQRSVCMVKTRPRTVRRRGVRVEHAFGDTP